MPEVNTNLMSLTTKRDTLNQQKTDLESKKNTADGELNSLKQTADTASATSVEKNSIFTNVSNELDAFKVPDVADEPDRANFTSTNAETGEEIFDSESFDREMQIYQDSVNAHDKAEKEKADLETRVAEAKTDADTAKTELDTANQNVETKQAEIDNLVKEINDVDTQIFQVDGDIEKEQMRTDFEDHSQGVRDSFNGSVDNSMLNESIASGENSDLHQAQLEELDRVVDENRDLADVFTTGFRTEDEIDGYADDDNTIKALDNVTPETIDQTYNNLLNVLTERGVNISNQTTLEDGTIEITFDDGSTAHYRHGQDITYHKDLGNGIMFSGALHDDSGYTHGDEMNTLYFGDPDETNRTDVGVHMSADLINNGESGDDSRYTQKYMRARYTKGSTINGKTNFYISSQVFSSSHSTYISHTP